jgi:hypothetical protein
VIHGFLRSPDGIFATFEAPGADTTAGSFNGTLPENINLHGAITGQYLDANGVNHGFLRAPSGAITTFDAPGAGTAPGQGTIPTSNNVGGAITGSYIDANGVAHGFLRTP